MNRKHTSAKLTVAAVALAAAFVHAPASPAAAQTTEAQYRLVMSALIEDADGWHVALQEDLKAIVLKPELACTDDFGFRVRQGGWLADDLTGSALTAPAGARYANERAAAGFAQMVDAADAIAASCDGSALEAAQENIDSGFAKYDENAKVMKAFWNTTLDSSRTPGLRLAPRPIGPQLAP
jgi:hypothetical protein